MQNYSNDSNGRKEAVKDLVALFQKASFKEYTFNIESDFVEVIINGEIKDTISIGGDSPSMAMIDVAKNLQQFL